MASNRLKHAKIKFVLIVALIIMGAGTVSRILSQSAANEFIGVASPIVGIVAVLLVIAMAFKFGDEILNLKKEEPDKRDVFDYATRDTSGAVLGKLAEIKYGERKKRDAFENYYKVK